MDEILAPSNNIENQKKFINLGYISKSMRLASLIIVFLLVITTFTAPIASTRVQLVDETQENTLYSKNIKTSIVDILISNLKKLISKEEAPLTDIEQDVQALREQDLSNFQKAENLHIFTERMSERIGYLINEKVETKYDADARESFVETHSLELTRNAALEAFAEQKENHRTELIQSNLEYLATVLNVFEAEFEVRNVNGVREFLACLQTESVDTLQEKYLVETYDISEENIAYFIKCNSDSTIIELAPAAINKDLAADRYLDPNKDIEYRSNYIYFDYSYNSEQYIRNTNSPLFNLETMAAILIFVIPLALYCIIRCIIEIIRTSINLVTKKKLVKYGFAGFGAAVCLVLATLIIGGVNEYSTVTLLKTEIKAYSVSTQINSSTLMAFAIVAAIITLAVVICNKILYRIAEKISSKD